MKKMFIPALLICSFVALGFSINKSFDKMENKGFIEVTVQNHLVSHGFDEDNKEIIEEVIAEKATKKFLTVDRIQSISEKYILTSYSFGRLVYWEYEGSYEELKEQLLKANGK